MCKAILFWFMMIVAFFSMLWLIAFAISMALGHTDPTPAPPTPAPVISTGGNISGTSPGNGCTPRTPPKFTPADTGNPNAWANPDWPGWAPIVVPTPGVGCSR